MKVVAFKLIFILIIVACINACQYHPEIKITRDYIYNSYWGDESWNAGSVSIWRVVSDDNIKNIPIESLSGFEIHNNVEKDSSFHYVTSFNKEHNPNTFYFNKKNDKTVWYIGNDISKTTDIIGSLELDTWYRFDTYIYKSWVYYVYVDKEGMVHTWAVNPVNI